MGEEKSDKINRPFRNSRFKPSGFTGNIRKPLNVKKIGTTIPKKLLILPIGLLTIGFLLLTASGLGSLEFAPGVPFPRQAEANFGPYTPSMALILVLFAIVAIFSFGLFLSIIKARNTLGLTIIGLAVVLGALFLMALVASAAHQELPESLPTPIVLDEIEEAPLEEDETELFSEFTETVANNEFEEPPLPAWISFTVSLLLILIVFSLAWLLLRKRFARNDDQRAAFVEIAEQAAREISAGQDWGDAITSCYAKMLEAVGETHKIGATENSLTPAEFVALMVNARMPAPPAERLTHLFERVRYGGKQATQSEIDEAVACLQEIVAVCRRDA
jgi:hypothetical protein